MPSDEGTTAPIAFAVGGMVLVLVITSMLATVQNIGSDGSADSAHDASRRSQAEDLANLLISSPGLVDCGGSTPCSWDPPYPLKDFTPDQYRLEGPSIWEIGYDKDQTAEANTAESPQDADNVIRLGLRSADGNRLDITKFRNLKDAAYSDSPDPGHEAEGDNRVNYDDAKRMFGLDAQNLDFHIRAYPALKSVDELLVSGLRDQYLRITYVGNALSSSSDGTYPLVEDVTCLPSPADSTYLKGTGMDTPGDDMNTAAHMVWRYDVKIKNTGATTTQFQVSITIDEDPDTKSNPTTVAKDQSDIVAPGASTVVHIDVPNLSGAKCSNPDAVVDVVVSDISGDVTDPAYAPVRPDYGGTPPSGTANRAFFTEIDKMHYDDSGADVIVQWDGTEKNDHVYWEVHKGIDGTGGKVLDWQWAGGSAPAHANSPNDRRFTVPMSALDAAMGTDSSTAFRLYSWVVDKDGNPGPVIGESILVLTDPSTQLDAFAATATGVQFDPAVEREVAMLERIMQKFCPADFNTRDTSVMTTKVADTSGPGWNPWSSSTWSDRCSFKAALGSDHTVLDSGNANYQPGDVFWDDKKLIMDELCKRLLDVGPDGTCGNSDPATLEVTNVLVVGSNVDHSSMTQGAFKWPLQKWVEAGGAVIAFGSPYTSTEWLQPIFHVGHDTSGGSLTTPDISHPLLTTPNTLDYSQYDNVGQGWRYTTPEAADNFANVVEQGGSPLTAVSDPGAFGGGTVVITTWRPYDVYGSGDASYNPLEGLNIMANFVTQGYRDLYLDYGAPLPEGGAVEPAFRFSQIEHEDLGLVDMNLALFVF